MVGEQHHDASIHERSSDRTAAESQVAAALARCASGDRSGLRVIFELEAPRMAGVARRMLRRSDLAEEAVQDAFVRIWRGAASFDSDRGSARTWIYTILRNGAIGILRDERRFVSAEARIEEAAPVSENALELLPEASALRRCLEQLDESRRRAVVLAYAYGLSHGELAGRLNVPLGTAKTWVRRGLSLLQGCLG